eukprot:3702047-Prymnesium_polylepis.1
MKCHLLDTTAEQDAWLARVVAIEGALEDYRMEHDFATKFPIDSRFDVCRPRGTRAHLGAGWRCDMLMFIPGVRSASAGGALVASFESRGPIVVSTG